MVDIAAPVLTSSKLEGVDPRIVATIKPHNGRGVSGAATFRNQAGHSGETLWFFSRWKEAVLCQIFCLEAYTLHPTPYTLHPIIYIQLRPKSHRRERKKTTLSRCPISDMRPLSQDTLAGNFRAK